MDDLFSSIKSHLAIAETEYNSLKSGRKSSAPRLRKSLMSLKTDSHKLRALTTTTVKALPTKSRKVVIQDIPKVEEAKVEVIEAPKKAPKKVPKKKTTVLIPESVEISA